MRVRAARHEDILPIGRVAEAGYWAGYRGLLKPATIGRLLATVFSPGAVSRRLLRGGIMVAEGNEGVSGFVDALPGENGVAVAAIATDPSQRRRGIGRALVDGVVERHAGLALSAEVLLGNLEGEAFFEGIGFVPGEVVPGAWFDEEVVERRWWREPGSAGLRR